MVDGPDSDPGTACIACIPTANPNLTLHTFDLRICIPDDPAGGPGTWYDVGDVQTGNVKPIEEILEHYNGQTGNMDAATATKRHWEIQAECDELTARMFSILAGSVMINEGGGCLIPLLGAGGIPMYAAELIHTFPDGIKQFIVHLWAVQIVQDWELPFTADAWLSWTMTLKSYACPTYPDRPYGYAFFNEPCPTS